jgi:hypothetical protein
VPKKTIYVNGQELEANAYWEVHLPVLEEAYVQWKGLPAAPVQSPQTLLDAFRRQ